jgi:hypothetical protein
MYDTIKNKVVPYQLCWTKTGWIRHQLVHTQSRVQRKSSGRIHSSDTSLPDTVLTLSGDTLRQIATEKRSVDAKQVIARHLSEQPAGQVTDKGSGVLSVSEEQCMDIFATCISSGNFELVTSIYSSMLNSRGSFASGDDALEIVEWPKATVSLSANLVKLLCRNLDTQGALVILKILRFRGANFVVQNTEDLHFGYVVECTDGSGRPLALMRPHEGSKIVSDSFSKYEYEIFSGIVVKAESESLVASLSWLKLLGARLVQSGATSAIHTMTLESPSGQQRVFKFGTRLSTSPAKVGDRVSIVCSPEEGKSFRQGIRYSGILSPSPPGKRPGEPLSITNHTIGNESTVLMRPSDMDVSSGPVNSWLLASFVVLASADAASSLVDPALPFLIAGVIGSSAATAALGTNIILPNLKKLPESALGIQETRQSLLQEHVRLTANIKQLVKDITDDVRSLARLWQLLNKMSSIDNKNAYATRIGRVVEAKDNVEERLEARVSMMSEYSKVISMIEIEVEMETEIPMVEYQDLKNQLLRVSEVESLQEEWRQRAEAQDEVERILRSYE